MQLQSPIHLMNSRNFPKVCKETRIGILKTIELELYQFSLTQEELLTGLHYLIAKKYKTGAKDKIFDTIACCLCRTKKRTPNKKLLAALEQAQNALQGKSQADDKGDLEQVNTFDKAKKLLGELEQTENLLQGKWRASNKGDDINQVKAFVKAVVRAYLKAPPEHVIEIGPDTPLIQNEVTIYSDENPNLLFSNLSQKQPLTPTPTDDAEKTNIVTARC